VQGGFRCAQAYGKCCGLQPIVTAGALVADPRKQLELITWNIGSLHLHRVGVFSLLVSAAPHLLCLQECSLRTPGTINALRAEARDLGYVVHASLQHNMVVLARRGLNFVPVKSLAGDEEYRMQRFAFKIGSSRILLRHRHAPSDGPCQRRALNQLLNDEPTGELLIDIGDFNELPAVGEGLVRAFPTENTYRHNSQTDDFVSCIDGAVVSHTLGLLPVVFFSWDQRTCLTQAGCPRFGAYA